MMTIERRGGNERERESGNCVDKKDKKIAVAMKELIRFFCLHLVLMSPRESLGKIVI